VNENDYSVAEIVFLIQAMLLAVVFAWITVTSQLISLRALNKKVHIQPMAKQKANVN